jgi:transposase InsO family protein
MSLNRSGYYSHLYRKLHPAEWIKRRETYLKLIQAVHIKHPSHGYRWINAFLRKKYGLVLSDRYVYECCRYGGIKATSNRIKYRKPKEESIVFPNLIKGQWDAKKPYEIIVSDMTSFYHKGIMHELTLYIDVFNNEILSYGLSAIRGDRRTYFDGLRDVINRLGQKSIVHTDQGAVYSSLPYNELLKRKGIVHSMSRIATPTDNPVIESLNGWIKDELFYDFKLKTCENLQSLIKKYIRWFNHDRPAYALKYKTPVQYRADLGF